MFIILKDVLAMFSTKYTAIYFVIVLVISLFTPYDTFADNIKDKQKYHIVQQGENLYRISVKYNIKQEEILKFNNNIKDNKIFIGQKIKLPDYVNLINTNDKKDDKIIEKQKSDNNKSGLINNSISNKAFSLSKNNSDNSKKTSINQDTFIWPVRGKVINKFGAITNGGEKNLGVNIATKHLEKVKAASSGTIRFVDKIDGYGEVIIMQHNNDFFTAYGFIDPLVSVNDKVKKGQIIASVKNNDNSNRSILYFSIRKGKKSYNPEEIIVNQL